MHKHLAQSQGGQAVSANDKADAAWDDYINQQQEEEIQKLQDRIKRLEDAGDALYANCDPSRWDSSATAARKLSDQNAWREAKEANCEC